MYGFHTYRSWVSVGAVFYIAAFMYLFVRYGDKFFTPLFIGVLIAAVVAVVYVIVWIAKLVIRTMNEDEINDR